MKMYRVGLCNHSLNYNSILSCQALCNRPCLCTTGHQHSGLLAQCIPHFPHLPYKNMIGCRDKPNIQQSGQSILTTLMQAAVDTSLSASTIECVPAKVATLEAAVRRATAAGRLLRPVQH